MNKQLYNPIGFQIPDVINWCEHQNMEEELLEIRLIILGQDYMKMCQECSCQETLDPKIKNSNTVVTLLKNKHLVSDLNFN